MKKFFLLFLFAIVGITLQAQMVKNLIPSVEKKLLYYALNYYPLAKGDSIKDETQYLFCSEGNKNFIYGFQSNGKINYSPKIELPEDFHFVKAFENEEDIIGIYSFFNKGVAAFYINTYDKRKPAWKPKKINSYSSFEKRDHFLYFTAVSPDNTKFCICTVIADKKNNFKSMDVITYNVEGQTIWENDISPDFSGQIFSINDIALTNAGDAYLCVSTFNEKKSKSANEKIYLYEVKEGNFNAYDAGKSIGYIDGARITELKNGNIFIAGYYAEKRYDQCKGAFALMYDTKSQTITNFSNSDFPVTFRKKDYDALNFDQIIELSNGKIVTLGEQRRYIEFRDKMGSSYEYFASNIMYTSFSSSGDIEEYKIIRKKQSFSSFLYTSNYKMFCLSYYAFEKNGSLYLLYNDNIVNTPTNESIKPINPFSHRNLGVQLVKIDGDDISSQILISGKTSKTCLQSLLFVNDNHLIISSVGKSITVDKVTVNF